MQNLFKTNSKSSFGNWGAHGILSREYSKTCQIEWTILEPNPVPVKNVNAVFIKGFFDKNFSFFDGKIDTIVHSHVLEHIYNPNDFIMHISHFLKEGQKLLFSIPNMEEMLKRKYTNCINFEHTIFLTEPYIDYLFSYHGFRQVDKEYFQQDHSIFYAFEKDSSVETIDLPKELYEHNKKLFFDYTRYLTTLIKELNVKKLIMQINRNPYFYSGLMFLRNI